MKKKTEDISILNKSKIKYFNNNNNFLIVDRNRLYQSLYLSILSLAINQKKKLNPILLHDKTIDEDILKIYESFGIKKFLKTFENNSIFYNSYLILKAIFYVFLCLIKTSYKGFEWFVKDFTVEKINIGDLVYDTYIRHGHSYVNPRIEIKFIKILAIAILRTLEIKNILIKKNIKFVITQTNAYSFNSGLSIRAGVYLGKKVFFQEQNHLTEYTQNKVYNGKFFDRNQRFSKIYKQIKLKRAEFFFKRRMSGKKETVHLNMFDGIGVKTKDILHSNRHKKKYNKNKLFNFLKCKRKYEKIILIGAHAFSDAPHSMGKRFIFMDYYSKLKKTLGFIYNNDEKNLWIIKPHPMEKFYGEVEVNRNLFQKFKKHNIKICPKNINTKNILELVDYVITARGTISIEAACLGVPSMTVGSTPFSGNKIVHECKTKKEYFSILKDLNKMNKMTKKKIIMAKKKIFYIETFEPYLPSSDIVPLNKVKRSLEKKLFFTTLHRNLRKKPFTNDRYYKGLLNYL